MPRTRMVGSSCETGFERYPRPEDYRGRFILENRPVKIRMAGWESDTRILQRAGWQVSVEEIRDPNSFHDTIRVALKHPKIGLYCVTNSVETSRIGMVDMGSYICLDVAHIACEMKCLVMPEDFSQFHPVDAETVYRDRTLEYQDIEAFKIFRPLKKESEIIVPKESVSELLMKIQSMQEPNQEILREGKRAAMRKLNREVNDYQLETNIVAQIATLV